MELRYEHQLTYYCRRRATPPRIGSCRRQIPPNLVHAFRTIDSFFVSSSFHPSCRSICQAAKTPFPLHPSLYDVRFRSTFPHRRGWACAHSHHTLSFAALPHFFRIPVTTIRIPIIIEISSGTSFKMKQTIVYTFMAAVLTSVAAVGTPVLAPRASTTLTPITITGNGMPVY